jgi:hypothetical protein
LNRLPNCSLADGKRQLFELQLMPPCQSHGANNVNVGTTLSNSHFRWSLQPVAARDDTIHASSPASASFKKKGKQFDSRLIASAIRSKPLKCRYLSNTTTMAASPFGE